jgi:O-methyltransferase involved in polyketide biosynthesis
VAVPGGIPRWNPEGPSSGRVGNYLLGGRNHGEADEAAAKQLEGICPEMRQIAAVNRLFITRAAVYAAEQGIAQFVDLGCGLPPGPQVHQMGPPGARCAYVDLDEMLLGELDVILGVADRVALVAEDLRDPDAVLADPGLLKVIDPGEPVCVLACLVLQFLPARAAARVIAGYAGRVAAGSLIAVSVPRFAGAGELAALREAYAPTALHEFSRAETGRLLGGLEIVPPGIVPAAGLRPGWQDAAQAPPDGAHVVAGIGRKR